MLASTRINLALFAALILLVPSAAHSQSESDNRGEFEYRLAEGGRRAILAPVVNAGAADDGVEQTLGEADELLPQPDDHVDEGDQAEIIYDIDSEFARLSNAFDESIGDKTIVRTGTSASSMQIVGRIHVDAWAFPENDADIDALEGGPAGPQSRLGFRRVRFGVRGDLPANMHYRIEMEFADGFDSQFRDVWLGWNELPVLHTLLLGNQKRPYGLDHLNSSRSNVFLERPYVIESFNQDARRWGLQSYGVSDDQRWNWRYGVFNQRLIQDEGNYLGDNLQMEIASRFANTLWYDEVSGGRGYLHWAVSSSYASPDGKVAQDNDPTGPDANEAWFRSRPEARSATQWLDTGRVADTDHYHLLGLECVTNLGPLQLVGEWQQIWLNRDAGAGADLEFWGAYVYAAYFITGEHMPWDRATGTLDRLEPFENFFLVRRCRGGVGGGWGAWQIAARYSYADFNDEDISGGVGESLTIGLNWYWTPNARMQFNWLNGSIKENGVTRAPDVLSGDYDILGTRFMVDF